MSVEMMARVWGMAVPHQEKMVLLAMADHADHDGKHIYPSLALLSWKTDYSVRQIRRIIRGLESKKILRRRRSQKGKPSTYEIQVNHAPMKPPRQLGTNLGHHDLGHHDLGHHDLGLAQTPDTMTGDDFIRSDICDTSHYNDARAEPSVKDLKALKTKKETTTKTTKDFVHVDENPADNAPDLLTVEELVKGWNLLCGGKYLMPKKRTMPESLKRKVRLRLKEHPEQAFWETVFNFCVATPFWRGDNERGWAVTFEWLMTNDTNCVKVYERATNGVA